MEITVLNSHQPAKFQPENLKQRDQFVMLKTVEGNRPVAIKVEFFSQHGVFQLFKKDCTM